VNWVLDADIRGFKFLVEIPAQPRRKYAMAVPSIKLIVLNPVIIAPTNDLRRPNEDHRDHGVELAAECFDCNYLMSPSKTWHN
jgi:hypothetical protein